MARVELLFLGVVLTGCPVPPTSNEQSRPPQPTATPTTAPVASSASKPSILSAHLARVDDPQLDGQDGLLLVFSDQLDAASMQPRAFVVSRADAGPVWPREAIFAPASEADENRSILLVGEFGDATEAHQPTHVAVIGALYTEEGTSLSGVGTAVVPFTTPPQVVAFEVLEPSPGRCEGAAQLLRTYWSDELRGVEPDDLARIRVQQGEDEASSVHPLRFDDHDLAHDEAGEDNVLDLCMAEPAPLHRVWVDAGAFSDPAGHLSAAIELSVS